MWPTLVLLLIFTGKVSGDGIESEAYVYSDETGLEETTRRPAAASVIIRGTARPTSSSPTPTSTVVDLPPPIPAAKEEDDLLQFFDKKGKLISVPVKKIPYRKNR